MKGRPLGLRWPCRSAGAGPRDGETRRVSDSAAGAQDRDKIRTRENSHLVFAGSATRQRGGGRHAKNALDHGMARNGRPGRLTSAHGCADAGLVPRGHGMA